MLGRITWEQLSDDALASLGDGADLDALSFAFDEEERIYCFNQDEGLAWVWDEPSLEWLELPREQEVRLRADLDD